MNGASGVGISVKSGQMAQLNRWFFRISVVARVAYSEIGLARMPPTVSTMNGIEVTWSRCEWVMKMWSTCDSSASVRSPTPVPASIRMSLSTRNEVVRRWRPPIPPEQPSTRRRIAAFPYFSSKAVTPSQSGGGGCRRFSCIFFR